MLLHQWTVIVRQGIRRSTTRREFRFGRAFLIALATLALLGVRARAENAAPASAAGRHVLVISVDGLRASFLTTPPSNLRIPNLRRLQDEGSSAEGVVGVYPSVTYPSHATLVTGRLPAEHGIYSNLASRQPGKNPHDWFWFAHALKVPALWDEVRRNGLTSAAVVWPVTVGAAIDWNVPEIWDPQVGDVGDYNYTAKFATPGLVQEALAALGAPQPGTDDDTVRTRLGIYLLGKYKPNLLLVHLAALDSAEHEHGIESPEAVATLERADARIGDFLAALQEAGLADSTDVFIVSDHGFLPVEREIRPNVLLARAGLIRANAQGRVIGGKVTTLAEGGSFFIYWPEARDFRREVDAALKPLRDQGVVWAVLNRQALADVGAEPAMQMALEAPCGASFDGGAKGEVVSKMKAPGGTHGYLPFRKNLEASFIAWGPSIKKGLNLHRIPMTAVAPTILEALGIENPQFGAHPPLADIFK